MLTNKQKQLLSFLIERIEQDGVSPSYEEICLELNLKSKSGIHRIVKALEERGYIKHLENKARAIAPTKYPNGQPYISNVIDINKLLYPKDRDIIETSNEDIKKIPILGKIAAGTPIEAISNYDQLIDVPKNHLLSEDSFALIVDGDSMIDEGIFDGDTVIISKINNVNNGDIVVALIDKEEATLKNLEKRVIVLHWNPQTNIIKPKYMDRTEL